MLDTCWEYDGYLTPNGYGLRGHRYTHRTAYEILVGPIPEGLHIDHLCRNRACYNPRHLEPVTRGQNVARGLGAKRDVCPSGHVYAEWGVPHGRGRDCLLCNRIRDRARWPRRAPGA